MDRGRASVAAASAITPATITPAIGPLTDGITSVRFGCVVVLPPALAVGAGVGLAFGFLAGLFFFLAFLFQFALAFFVTVVGGCQICFSVVQGTVAGAGASAGACQRTAPR